MIRLVTHPSPRIAADGYRRFRTMWPAMCEAVSAIRLPLAEAGSNSARGDVGETQAAPAMSGKEEKEKRPE